jgi:4-hydroxythreonine-4-phosphate dehydrogenase
MRRKPIIAMTAGDVAGIGPEVLVKTLLDTQVQAACQVVVICHPAVLQRAITVFDCEGISIESWERSPSSRIELEKKLARVEQQGGSDGIRALCINPAGEDVLQAPERQVSAFAGDAAFQYLLTSIRLAQSGIVDAIVTAPLNKAALHAAGHDFPGHTEILAKYCGVKDFSMMLHMPESRLVPIRKIINRGAITQEDELLPVHEGLSVVHVTLHTSVKSVPQLLTTDGVVDAIRLLHEFLSRIQCSRKAIGVCALNPHGGEGGLFGDEESRIIQPAVEHATAENLNVTGPLPVDTLMRRAFVGEFDGIVAMYHDQGHIPIKLVGFDSAVNITLGLPIIRTSPTHGTGFDRAWSGKTPADPSGMIEAVLTALNLVNV